MVELSEKSVQEIHRNIAKYPADQKQAAVMAVLTIVQDETGWLDASAIALVAQILDMPMPCGDLMTPLFLTKPILRAQAVRFNQQLTQLVSKSILLTHTTSKIY